VGLRATTYRQLLERADVWTAWLAVRGVTRGDRAAILADNAASWIAAYLGILRAGAVVVPLDTAYATTQVHTILKDSSARWLFTSARYLETARTALATLEGAAPEIAMLDDGPARARSVRLVDARHGRGQVAVVMTEGRKREVRRLLAAVGLPVTRLVRVRIGPIRLGRLKPGERRELMADELLELQRAAAARERRAARAVDDGPRPPTSGM